MTDSRVSLCGSFFFFLINFFGCAVFGSVSRAQELWLPCSKAQAQQLCTGLVACTCGIFLNQGQNPCPLHCQADSYPLYHYWVAFLKEHIFFFFNRFTFSPSYLYGAFCGLEQVLIHSVSVIIFNFRNKLFQFPVFYSYHPFLIMIILSVFLNFNTRFLD